MDEQAWREARCGRVTASRVADIMAKTKSGWAASRKNYISELVVERLTGAPANGYVSPAMEHGINTEAEARAAYAFEKNVDVTGSGKDFLPHPDIEMFGASPDAFVGEDGLAEFKCPNTATHIDTLTNGRIKGAYLTQMQAQMACTGRQWCDFVSYDPRLPGHLRLFVKRVSRDNARIAEMETEVRTFLAELDGKIEQLNERQAA